MTIKGILPMLLQGTMMPLLLRTMYRLFDHNGANRSKSKIEAIWVLWREWGRVPCRTCRYYEKKPRLRLRPCCARKPCHRELPFADPVDDCSLHQHRMNANGSSRNNSQYHKTNQLHHRRHCLPKRPSTTAAAVSNFNWSLAKVITMTVTNTPVKMRIWYKPLP